MAKSISRLIILLPASKKQERGEQVQWNNGVLECWRSESHYSTTTQSGNPIKPAEEVEIVGELPDEPQQRKPVPRGPVFCRPAQLRRAGFEFLFKKTSHTVAHFCR